jgi:hypothetical protein
VKGYLTDRKSGRKKPLANLSQYHPDYGMTPAEHEERKKLRAAGKVDFVSKEQLRARRQGLARRMGL